MPEPRWSSTPPTEPGRYVVRRSLGHGMYADWIVTTIYEGDPGDGWSPSCRFFGPIPEPDADDAPTS